MRLVNCLVRFNIRGDIEIRFPNNKDLKLFLMNAKIIIDDVQI